jgi:hypothetical protein
MKRNDRTTDDGYNGWTNYETWNAALWMNNDEYSQSYWEERASEVAEEAENDEAATHDLAEMLGEQLRDDAPEISGFYGDVLSAAIRSVNTHEIAKNLIDDYRREAIREQVQNEEDSEVIDETPDERAGRCR